MHQRPTPFIEEGAGDLQRGSGVDEDAGRPSLLLCCTLAGEPPLTMTINRLLAEELQHVLDRSTPAMLVMAVERREKALLAVSSHDVCRVATRGMLLGPG